MKNKGIIISLVGALLISISLVLTFIGGSNKAYIEIKGESSIKHTYGEEYKDLGYDLKDDSLYVTVDNNVNVNKLGEQQVTYIVLKGDKEVERKVRIVNVVDDKKPNINCSDEIEVFVNSTVNDDVLKKELELSIKDNYDKEENINVELTYDIDSSKEGDYKLSIKATDSNKNEASKEVNVKVTKAHITKISLNKTSISIDEGSSTSLSVSYYPKEATDDKKVTWTSSNESVVKVSNGKVTGVKKGSGKVCALLASNNNIKACAEVKVTESQIIKFQKYITSNLGYSKKSNNVYQMKNSGLVYTVNFNNKTFYVEDGAGPLTYYYKKNTAKSVFKNSGVTKTLNYNYSTNKVTSCTVNPSYYSALCNNNDSAVNSLKALKTVFDKMVEVSGVNKNKL